MSDVMPDSADAAPRRWSAPPREGGDTAGRSRSVAILKLLLPGLSAVLILTLIIWPQVTERQNGSAIDFATVDSTSSSSTMTNARFVGGDSQNVNVTADTVVQDSDFPSIVHMTNIAGDTTTEDGVWMHLSALKGLFDQETNRLSLNGQVALFSDQGNELHSENAVIDLSRTEVTGSGVVRGHGPYGRFTANGFEIRDAGNTLILSGGVHLVIETGGAAK